MKIILRETIDHLGEIGDVIDAKDGYARNFLLPSGKGIEATPGELKLLEARRKKVDAEKAKALAEANALGEKLAKVSIIVPVKLSEEGQMYGSVGVADVAGLLAKEGFELEKRQVLLPEPIREVGIKKIPIRLHRDVTVEIQLTVVKEEEKKKE